MSAPRNVIGSMSFPIVPLLRVALESHFSLRESFSAGRRLFQVAPEVSESGAKKKFLTESEKSRITNNLSTALKPRPARRGRPVANSA